MAGTKGSTPLSVTHPEIAREADGWDPTSFLPFSNKKVQWRCLNGHSYVAAIYSRTAGETHCPYCSNRKVLQGFNDLQTTHPELASEAYGWDPTTVVAGSNKKYKWKCNLGHIYESAPNKRTSKSNSRNCAVCTNQKVLKGFNDLATTNPELVNETYGWDPTEVIAGSNRNREWQCSLGHIYISTPHNRSGQNETGCPVCNNKILLKGFNDLGSTHPELAKEADGWDATTVMSGTHKRLNWKCNKGHNFSKSPSARTIGSKSGCPFCSNRRVLKGFNDFATTHPNLLGMVHGWDPELVTAGQGIKKKWICEAGHIWSAQIVSITQGTRCPSCTKSGFDPNEPGYLYFLEHPKWEMFEIGITNIPDNRLNKHMKIGWEVLEIRGPMDGHLTQQWETAILRMLRAMGADLSNPNIAGKFDGYTEAWSKSTFEVKSIQELMKLTNEYEEK
jgi:DNA-directed RNA polymerase subunit RPC12/RpoP